LNTPESLEKPFRYFRSQRMVRFERTFRITPQTTVLDVGGSSAIWQFARVQPKLTFLNLLPAIDKTQNSAIVVAGDGRMLPFADAAFDIVFSNSVIEHVGTTADQQMFASEVARVGKRYWVQTPNRRFPFEMHVMLPFVHYLPRKWQERIVHRFTGWELLVPHTKDIRRDYLYHFLNELHLLNRRDLIALFPDAQIASERFLGLPKSLIAYR
jgi:SAM-dependent methyltransferase